MKHVKKRTAGRRGLRTLLVMLILLILLLCFGLCGCRKVSYNLPVSSEGQESAESGAEGSSDADAESDAPDIPEEYRKAGLVPLEEGDPAAALADAELPALAQLLAYKATFGDAFDEANPGPEDFWTVLAMAVDAVPPESAVDKNGIAHVKRAVLADYAAALFSGFSEEDSLPGFDRVYGVSANPGSSVVDLDGLSMQVDSELLLLGKDESLGSLVLRVRIADEAGIITQNTWDCLASVREGEGHMLGLEILKFYCVDD